MMLPADSRVLIVTMLANTPNWYQLMKSHWAKRICKLPGYHPGAPGWHLQRQAQASCGNTTETDWL